MKELKRHPLEAAVVLGHPLALLGNQTSLGKKEDLLE